MDTRLCKFDMHCTYSNMFYLSINTILIILPYQCLTSFQLAEGYQLDVPRESDSYDANDCSLWISDQGIHDIPIAFTSDSHGDSMICPDVNGHVNIKHNSYVKLSCGTSEFTSATFRNTREINVKCIKKDSVEYDGKTYSTTEIKCKNGSDVRQKETTKKCKLFSIEYFLQRRKDVNNCLLWVPSVDYNMPIPFRIIGSNLKLLHPDINGNIIIKPNDEIQLTCAMRRVFMPPIRSDYCEITIKCLNRTYLEYEGRSYEFSDFKCSKIPAPMLRITKNMCQNEQGRIIETGFKTKSGFLTTYKICYDMKYKNTYFTWYNMKSPYHLLRQVNKNLNLRPDFIRTTLFGANVDELYKYQDTTLKEILGSENITKHYIKPGQEFLTRGHLIARTEFNYIFEQSTTFFYENTAPQWHSFNIGVWRDFEKFFKRSLSKSNSRHIIMAGTFGVCDLVDEKGEAHPYFLFLPDKVRVPQYIWRMDYNVNERTGIVFVGLNNPYKKVNKSMQLCQPVPCPKKLKLTATYPPHLFFCCSKESFEKAYGKMDEIVFQEFK